MGAILGWVLVAGLRAVGLVEADASFDLLAVVPAFLTIILSEGEVSSPVVTRLLGLCFGATVVAFTLVVLIAAAFERVPGLRSRRDLEYGILVAGWAVIPAGLVLLGAASDQWRSAVVGLGVVLFAVTSAWLVVVVVIFLGLKPWLERFR